MSSPQNFVFEGIGKDTFDCSINLSNVKKYTDSNVSYDQATQQICHYIATGDSKKALYLLQAIPQVALLDNPRLFTHFIWALLCERKFEQARIAREFFESNSYIILSDADSATIKATATNVAVLGLLQYIFENDLNAISAEAMERLRVYIDIPTDYRRISINIYSFLLFMNGRYEKARFFAVKAKMLNAEKRDQYNYAISTVLIALCDRALGRYDIAMSGIATVIDELSVDHDHCTPAVAIALMVKAMLLYDGNQLEEARALTSKALPTLGIPAISEFLVHGYLTQIKIEIWEHNFAGANELLQSLIDRLDNAGFERWSSFITHEQVRAALIGPEYASEKITQELDQKLNYYNTRYCPAVGHIPLRTQLMLALYQKRFDAATNLLGQLSQVCLLQRDAMLRIILLSGTAVIEFFKDNPQDACEYLNQALRASQESGIVRALFDEVFGFGDLFNYALNNELIDNDLDPALIEQLKTINYPLTKQETANCSAKKSGSDKHRTSQVKTGNSEGWLTDEIETLTQTEHKILVFLSQGLPNKTIAEQCGINISTVKWHLKNIYSKLYVSNRTEAVLKAQQLQLIQ